VNIDFWNNKRVLITGHTGFKGSWLALLLNDMGAQVTGFALAPNGSQKLFGILGIERDLKSVIGDVCDSAAITHAIKVSDPEIIIHMAAQSLVRYSYENPVDTFQTNVMGTVSLMNSLRESSSVKSVVIVTSDKCYKNLELARGYHELDVLGGYDPYSCSKACSEMVVSCFQNSFLSEKSLYNSQPLSIASARAGNVVGGGDWANDRLVPDILAAVMESKEVNIRSPLAVRPWQHVLEPLTGYLMLAEKLYIEGPAYSGAWNFGPNELEGRTVAWLTDRFLKLWGGYNVRTDRMLGQPHEASQLRLDCAKAHDKLEWWPRWSIEETIERIVNWHKAYNRGEDMRKWSLSEIGDFFYSEPSKS
jgi:CDP-glucose 4,6-dehydratase